jgi:hypothetical protein
VDSSTPPVPSLAHTLPSSSPPTSLIHSPSPIAPSPPPLRKSTRLTKPPPYLLDYACSNIVQSTPYPIQNTPVMPTFHPHNYLTLCLYLLKLNQTLTLKHANMIIG